MLSMVGKTLFYYIQPC